MSFRNRTRGWTPAVSMIALIGAMPAQATVMDNQFTYESEAAFHDEWTSVRSFGGSGVNLTGSALQVGGHNGDFWRARAVTIQDDFNFFANELTITLTFGSNGAILNGSDFTFDDATRGQATGRLRVSSQPDLDGESVFTTFRWRAGEQIQEDPSRWNAVPELDGEAITNMPDAVTMVLNATERTVIMHGASFVEDGSNTRSTLHGLTEDDFDGSFHMMLDTFSDRIASGGHVWLEADSLVVVPEPASLALLGLGGLAMLGRRRR